MTDQPRFTPQTAKVLDFLATAGEHSGADISRKTSLKSGTLYPLLLRLEQAGWLSSRWEEGEAALLGRPRRRFYTVTGLGLSQARSAALQQVEIFGRLAW